MPPVHDTHYLQDVVGDALARGCAATISAQPNDPVEYLGNWLLRFVKNAEIVGDFANEKQTELERRKAELEAAATAAAKVKEEQEVRRKAIVDLCQTVAEPRELLQKAVDLITQFTAAGAAYAAMVADPEEPDWTYPEDPEDPAAAESEDEADPPAPVPPPENEEAPAATEEPPADAEAGDSETPPKKIPKPIDYSKKYLSYLAATGGQEFMLTTELKRPPPPPEDDPEAKPEPTPFTFRVLDERRPMLYTANAAFEASMRFFRGFPKIGAYQACGVQSPATGEFKAVIAADTLFPESGGQALSQEDQDFIWHVSRALSQAFEVVEKQAQEAVEGRSAQEVVDTLKNSIVSIYHPPKDPAAGEAPAAEGAAAEGEAAAEGGDAPPPEAGDGGDDPISLLRAEIKTLEGQLKDAETAKETATVSLEKAQAVLAAVKEALGSVSQPTLPVLRHLRNVPQATFHVLKAVLHVLGKEPETFLNWKRAFAYFDAAFFAELQDYNATQERDLEAWKRARCCYKALGEEGGKKLAEELPDSQLGVLLLMWLKEVRKVGRRSAVFRTSMAAEEKLAETLESKRVELQEAERKKAEEEEAARKAAEEAAAAEAAAAAAGEGAGGEGEGEAAAEGEAE